MPKVHRKHLKAEIEKLKSHTVTLNTKLLEDLKVQCIELIKAERLKHYSRERRNCCIQDCTNTAILVYYCKTCRKSQFICSADFRGRTRSRICPVCQTRSITLRCAQIIN